MRRPRFRFRFRVRTILVLVVFVAVAMTVEVSCVRRALFRGIAKRLSAMEEDARPKMTPSAINARADGGAIATAHTIIAFYPNCPRRQPANQG